MMKRRAATTLRKQLKEQADALEHERSERQRMLDDGRRRRLKMICDAILQSELPAGTLLAGAYLNGQSLKHTCILIDDLKFMAGQARNYF
jgi:hypothetical protein